MEKIVSILLTDPIIVQCAERFGADKGSLDLISDVENFVYNVTRKGEAFILRVTHSSHRTAAELRSELDFMNYLAERGISAPTPIQSVTGEFVESIEAGGTQFLVTAFTRLPGKNIIESGACNPITYQHWGKVVGKMHALTVDYQPAEGVERRPVWDANDLIANAPGYLVGQTEILKKYDRLMAKLRSLPTEPDSYGLLHTDVSDINFFIHEGAIHVFDFDDAEYHWFAYDIAVILFDSLPYLPHKDMDQQEFGRYFWQHFYAGYSEEYTLNTAWLRRIPLLMKLREMAQYAFMYKKWDFDDLSTRRREHSDMFRANILGDVDMIGFDLAKH